MKKLFAVIALVAFLGGMSAPVIANDNSALLSIELADKDPKKKEAKKSATEKSASDCATTEKKASDCATTEKKASDCATEKKSSDCEKTCDSKK